MAGSVNSNFQDDNLNDNGVPYVSVLLNIAVESFEDPDLISNAISSGSGSNRSYQLVGIDASPNRTSKELYGFNYFFRSLLNNSSGIPGDRRRVVVLNGSTGEVLLNESALGDAMLSERVITAINSITLAPEESFASWIAETGILEAEQGAHDDPDGDGLTNLLEYALGLNPALADAGAGPRMESGTEGPRLIFQRSKSAAVEPITIEIGTSLADFAMHSPAPEDVNMIDQGETELISVVLPEMSGAVFARLRTSAQ